MPVGLGLLAGVVRPGVPDAGADEDGECVLQVFGDGALGMTSKSTTGSSLFGEPQGLPAYELVRAPYWIC
jgi:hypothetical protein